MDCRNCGTSISEHVGNWSQAVGWVHDRTGAKVCPGVVGVATPVSLGRDHPWNGSM